MIFGISILVLLMAGECYVRKLPNQYKYKHQWMSENADKVQTLILGSSHAYYGINPEKMGGVAFNLANISQNFEYDYYLLRQYIGHCSNIRNVILPISYFSFFSPRFEDGDNWWYAINYKMYMNCNIHSDFSIYNFELSHPSVYFGKLRSRISFTRLLNYTEWGMGTDYSVDNKSAAWANGKAAVARHTASDWSDLDENLSRLHQILDLCNEANANLILITTPTWHTYYENLDKRQLAKMYEVIDSFQQENPLVKYYNFMTDGRFAADDFYDCDHLSNLGADKFSLILNDEVLDK